MRISKAGISFWPLSTFPIYLVMLSMQHESRGKAAKVDENVAQWTKICRSTVLLMSGTTCADGEKKRKRKISIQASYGPSNSQVPLRIKLAKGKQNAKIQLIRV